MSEIEIGTSSEALRKAAARHYIWHNTPKAGIDPLILREGSGVRVTDVDGRSYVDLMSSFSRASTLGYGRREIVDAVTEQLSRLHLAGSTFRVADTNIRLAQRIAEIAPGSLDACSFVSTGSEAVEGAIKLAKAYHHHAGRKPRAYKVISRWGAYHGSAGSAMAASDSLNIRHAFEPGAVGVSHIPAPSSYRRPFDLDLDTWNRMAADHLEQQIIREGPELVAAFIAEPVMQFNGPQPAPPGYLARVREICTEYDVVFIADEVITGFGRAGEWFAVDHWGVEPDIITSAKGLTAGYVPLAAVIASERIWEAVPAFRDVHTYGGHPAAAAASLAVIEVCEREGLIDRSARVGAEAVERLRALEELDLVGEVRGMGMWFAIDLTSDKRTRALPGPEVGRRIVQRARERGVLLITQTGTTLEMAPALTIAPGDLDAGLSVIEDLVREAAAA